MTCRYCCFVIQSPSTTFPREPGAIITYEKEKKNILDGEHFLMCSKKILKHRQHKRSGTFFIHSFSQDSDS